MSTKRIRLVVVDDEEPYRNRLAKKLSDRTLHCIAMAPPSAPVPDEIVDAKPDAVLVDYQLTQAQKGSTKPPAAYLGSLLVAAIRQRLPTTPIVLVTRYKLASAGKAFLDSAADLDEAFDDLRFKEDVDAQPALLRTELHSLVAGYRVLAKAHGSWNDVLAALQTPAYARDEVRRFGSPLGSLQSESFRPGSVARWIRRVVLKFPGPLVDDLRAATDLGITVKSLGKPSVLKWLRPALYTGVFATEERRWWRGALRARADEIGAKTSIAADRDESTTFARIWNKKHPAAKVSLATCCVCTLPTRDAVCEVLHRPVMLRCSVQYYPDNRPPGFDVARMSFKAIRETELNEDSFASNVWPIVCEIESSNDD